MRAHNVVGRQSHPASVILAHAGDFVFAVIQAQSPLLSSILCHVERASCNLCEPKATHPGLPSTIGREMCVEVGGTGFPDQRVSQWLFGRGGGPGIHEMHSRLHVTNRVMP